MIRVSRVPRLSLTAQVLVRRSAAPGVAVPSLTFQRRKHSADEGRSRLERRCWACLETRFGANDSRESGHAIARRRSVTHFGLIQAVKEGSREGSREAKARRSRAVSFSTRWGGLAECYKEVGGRTIGMFCGIIKIVIEAVRYQRLPPTPGWLAAHDCLMSRASEPSIALTPLSPCGSRTM